MRPITVRQLLPLAVVIFSFSIIAMLVNYLFYNYPGNNYFPENMLLLFTTVILVNLGLILYFNHEHRLRHSGIQLGYFFITMSLIALATNAVQLTPFNPIDRYIASLEARLHIDMVGILLWTNHYIQFKHILSYIYDSLALQMTFIPLLVIALGRFQVLKEYYFMLLLTTLIGFIFYYFFPTTGPASIIHSSLFSNDQIATGFKFKQIHDHIIPTTIEGGLIALPSFHTIWALLCVYLLKEWMIPFILLSIINLLLIASCVLLGWHYLIDVVAGIALTLLCLLIMNRIKTKNIS